MLPKDILEELSRDIWPKIDSLQKEKRWPKTVQSAGNRAGGLLPAVTQHCSLDSQEEAREFALELVIYGLIIWQFWGQPAKELKKYGRFRNRRNRLGDKG